MKSANIVRVSSVRGLAPYQQGQFDGLCGVYATVNALQLLSARRRPLASAECEQLYRLGIDVVVAADRLPVAACWGISLPLWHRIVTRLCARATRTTGLKIEITRPFRGRSSALRREIMAAIEHAVRGGRPVLLLLRGAYRHFTVVSGYSATRLILHDSYGYRWIEKASCGSAVSNRRHQLAPNSLVILELIT